MPWDSSAAAVVESDHRRTDLHRRVHHLADLLRVALGQRAAEHREVLCEGIDQAAVDRARAGDHAVAGDLLRLHPEVGAIMLDEHVIFFEAAGIEQHRQALAGSQAALGMLGRDPFLAAAKPRQLAASFELFDRGCHSADRPHLSPTGLFLPRAVHRVNRTQTGGRTGCVTLLSDLRLAHCALGSAIAAPQHGRIRINFDQGCGTVIPLGPFI